MKNAICIIGVKDVRSWSKNISCFMLSNRPVPIQNF